MNGRFVDLRIAIMAMGFACAVFEYCVAEASNTRTASGDEVVLTFSASIEGLYGARTFYVPNVGHVDLIDNTNVLTLIRNIRNTPNGSTVPLTTGINRTKPPEPAWGGLSK